MKAKRVERFCDSYTQDMLQETYGDIRDILDYVIGYDYNKETLEIELVVKVVNK